MIQLSISIMHCSWNAERVTMLRQIMERLNPHLDQLINFHIADDVEKKGIWWNYKQALAHRHPRSTHHLVLQDDMLPCKNFIPALHKILYLKQAEIIHIFASNNAVHEALAQDKHWYTQTDGSWGGSIILPRHKFDWVDWADEYLNDFSKNCDDQRFDHYVMCHRFKIWSVAPSLIEHIGYDKSLIGNSPKKWRLSKKYIGDDNPLEIDWTKGLTDPVEGNATWATGNESLAFHLKRKYRLDMLKKIGFKSHFFPTD